MKKKRFERPSLEQVEWVFKCVVGNAKVGGSFRHLIYDVMGFEGDSEAYARLYHAGGMEITNNLVLEEEE